MTRSGEPAAAAEVSRDVVRVGGPDAPSFLQGQLSQDVSALSVGGSAFSLLLAPQGKVEAYLRVTRTAEDVFLLDVDAGWADAVVARLERFKLRVECTIEVLDNWAAVALRTPDAPTREAIGSRARAAGMWPVEAEIPDGGGVDVLGPAESLRAFVADSADASGPGVKVALLDPSDYEAMRIEGGVPRMGSELTTSTIPAEAGIVERSVSFTKGCYTGQELVARIDSRGNKVPRLLRLVIVETPADPRILPEVGWSVFVDDQEVGRLTSVARSPTGEAFVALASVRREVEVPTEATVAGSDPTEGRCRARVQQCPPDDRDR